MHIQPARDLYPISADQPCDLGWALSSALDRYRSLVEPLFAQFPRGARGYQLLYTVVHYRVATQNELAAYLGIDRTVLTYVIEDLCRAGLAEKQVSSEDRRIRIVEATPQGRALVEETQGSLRQAEEIFFAGLSPDDSRIFRYLLSNIAVTFRSEH